MPFEADKESISAQTYLSIKDALYWNLDFQYVDIFHQMIVLQI